MVPFINSPSLEFRTVLAKYLLEKDWLGQTNSVRFFVNWTLVFGVPREMGGVPPPCPPVNEQVH